LGIPNHCSAIVAGLGTPPGIIPARELPLLSSLAFSRATRVESRIISEHFKHMIPACNEDSERSD
jgi:hypothetical protein